MKQVTNKIVILLAVVVLVGAGSSCNKLIDVPDNAGGQLVTSKVFTDSLNATAGVLAMYGADVLINKYVDIYTGLTGDELLYGGTSTQYSAMYVDSLYAGSQFGAAPVATLWSGFYGKNAIYQANAALEGLAADQDSTISFVVRNQLIGECEVVRAFCYFNLVNLYGGVPLVTGSGYQVNRVLPRTTVDSVYKQITRDLLDAQVRLRQVYPSAGKQRPNRYTASALLARAYLYSKQWAAAQAMADTVIKSGLYSLAPNLANVFLDNSTEAIWQLGAGTTTAPKSAPGVNPFYTTTSLLAPSYTLSSPLMQAFEPGDARQANWTATVTGFYINSAGNFISGSYSYATKYRNIGTRVYNNTIEDLMMVRLAEMYLIRSEARAQQGDLAGAMQDVNTIRSRAGLTTPVTAATLPAALGLILHERQVEFFCEWGHRWMDLKRMDSIGAVMSRAKPASWPADNHAALYPISFAEFQNNPYMTQNPGY
jgi:hypothetical protein